MYLKNIHHKQTGVVLVIGMLMLIVLTLIGLTGMRMSTFEEKMSGNLKDKHVAFEAAEAALMVAEADIEANIISTGTFDTDGTDGLYDDRNEQIWKLIDWNSTDSTNDNEAIEYSAFDSAYKVNKEPRYVIEHYATVREATDTLNLGNYNTTTGAGETEMFRITARGTGSNDSAVVILQTTYGKKL
jgi:type IV pilus assembly protein PilX